MRPLLVLSVFIGVCITSSCRRNEPPKDIQEFFSKLDRHQIFAEGTNEILAITYSDPEFCPAILAIGNTQPIFLAELKTRDQHDFVRKAIVSNMAAYDIPEVTINYTGHWLEREGETLSSSVPIMQPHMSETIKSDGTFTPTKSSLGSPLEEHPVLKKYGYDN